MAKNFYGSLFEWKITGDKYEDFAYWTINTGKKHGGGMWEMPKEKPAYVLVYILVDDVDKTLEKAVKPGGEVIVPKSKENGTAMATVADPNGNFFGFYENTKKGEAAEE